jgi:DNA-binding transcriptional MerR regulator
MPKAAPSKRGNASRHPKEIVIPDKLYFRIGDVAKLCGVEAYVLRFWESEFPQLRPNKSGTGQRLYRKRDVEMVLKVRRLLHDEGYTIAGARQVLAQESVGKKASPQLKLIENGANGSGERSPALQAKLQKVRSELRELLGILSSAPGRSEAKTRTAKPAVVPSRPNLFE